MLDMSRDKHMDDDSVIEWEEDQESSSSLFSRVFISVSENLVQVGNKP